MTSPRAPGGNSTARALAPAAAVALGVAASACTRWTAWTPGDRGADPADAASSRALRLVLDESQSGELVCESGFCQQWYRVDVPRSGKLVAEATVAAADAPLARLVLHDGVGNVLARANNRHGTTLRVASQVKRGAAPILVQCAEGRLPYTLVVRLE